MAGAILHVCVTCRGEAGAEPAEVPRPGARLHAALAALACPEGVDIRPVECLSVCSRGCAVALSAPGKWSYVYAGMDPERHAADILAGAARYAVSPDGVPPWRERPEIFRKQVVSRVPPLDLAHAFPIVQD